MRKKSDSVQLKVRVKERLRARVDRSAKRHGISLNAEIGNRLEKSFNAEERTEEIAAAALETVYAAFGGKGRYHMFLLTADVLAGVEKETGEHWLMDEDTRREGIIAISSVFERLGRSKPERSENKFLRGVTARNSSHGEIGKGVAERYLASIVGTEFPKKPLKKPE